MATRKPGSVHVVTGLATDMRLHGAPFILIEFGFSVLAGAGISAAEFVALFRTGQSNMPVLISAIWLAAFALNCLAAFIVALRLTRNKRYTELGTLDTAAIRRFTIWLPLLIVLPLGLLVATLIQVRR